MLFLMVIQVSASIALCFLFMLVFPLLSNRFVIVLHVFSFVLKLLSCLLCFVFVVFVHVGVIGCESVRGL